MFLAVVEKNRCISGIDRGAAVFAIVRLFRKLKKKLCNFGGDRAGRMWYYYDRDSFW